MRVKINARRSSAPRRRQILDAALACFLENGFEATTIEQIRDSSGASHGSIYHHFGSKEAIALALYVEGMTEYQERMLDELRRQQTARDSIRAMIDVHMQWTAADRNRALYLTRAGMADTSGSTSAKISEVNQDFFHAIAEWFAPFAERGEIIGAPADLYVSLILGPATHFARHWLANRLTHDLKEAAETFAEAAWRSISNEMRQTNEMKETNTKTSRAARATKVTEQ